MIPDIADLTGLPIHWFGLFLAAAFWAAGAVAAREFTRKGLDPDAASSALIWAIVGGLLGARLWLVMADLPSFVADPLGALLTGSGWVFYGGLVGGALAVTIVFRRRGIAWLQGADGVAPGIVLAQAIGRIGCQVSGDGDWGIRTTLPWGMRYPHAIAGWPHPPDVYVHPTPIYECLAYLGIFGFLWWRRSAPAPDGSTFAWYLVLASLARFAVEFVRINGPVAFGLTAAQLMSVVLIATGGVLLLGRRRWQPAAA